MSAALVYCPSYASYFGFLGAASALVFGNMGAAYGTWKSATGMAAMAKLPRHRVQPEMVIKSMLPVIMAGVCGIYGLIIAVIIANNIEVDKYSLYSG
jgi:V-type H+-transporting ATPase proteolipid subunit